MNIRCDYNQGAINSNVLLKVDKDNNLDTDSEIAQSTKTEIIALEELDYDEQQRRQHLERVVERAFYEAGKALRELRDRKLYRSTHKTFESYIYQQQNLFIRNVKTIT